MKKNQYQDRQYTYNVALRCFRATMVAVEGAINVTYAECVSLSLGIQHEVLMNII